MVNRKKTRTGKDEENLEKGMSEYRRVLCKFANASSFQPSKVGEETSRRKRARDESLSLRRRSIPPLKRDAM